MLSVVVTDSIVQLLNVQQMLALQAQCIKTTIDADTLMCQWSRPRDNIFRMKLRFPGRSEGGSTT